MSAQPDKFALLFDKPSVEVMHALSSRDFERFVAYVLRRGGYVVNEVGLHFLRGVDLEMRLPNKQRIFGGVECKKFASRNSVRARVVMGLLGAPAVGRGAKPFVITTSDFVDAAHQMAQAGPRQAYLISGAQLMRYIQYVKGSRRDDDDIGTSLSPEFFAGKNRRPTEVATNILTIANNKGGVGKTTTAYYLGAELARQGKRVLLIDLDGQANLTERALPGLVTHHLTGDEFSPNIAEYFDGKRRLDQLVLPAEKHANLGVIPSDPFLTLRDPGGSGRPDIETRFVRDVRDLCVQQIPTLGGTPDWIIIDTPPAMSVFTRAGIAAAQFVLAPLRPRTASVTGTTNMLRTLRTMNALTGNGPIFLGTVITHWDGLKMSENFEDQVLPDRIAGHGGRMFMTRIPIDNQLEPLEPGAKIGGAVAYATLAQEVEADVNERRKQSIEQ